MSLDTPNPLPLMLQASGKHIAQPLPAEEQLAVIFHLANDAAVVETTGDIPPQTPISLSEAYATCQRIIRQHSKSFFFSTQFLPVDKRRAVYALYAFCRTTDDTVDMAQGDPAYALAEWVRQVRAPVPPHNPVLLAWRDTQTTYHLSPMLVNELLAGIAMDLTITRYETFADLWLYCYRVASVVGLLSIGITGTAAGAEPYAIKLGVALQLTNILRDVGEDARRGRIYLPQEDLERFGLYGDDILNEVCDERFHALMDFEIARARRLYAESWDGLALLPPDSRLGIGAAAAVYRGILDKVVANSYDVYHKRAHLTLSEKLMMTPSIWTAVRRLNKYTQHPLMVDPSSGMPDN